MKILIAAPTFLPSRKANTVQVMKMAQASQIMGHEVRVLVPDNGGKRFAHWGEAADHYGLSEEIDLHWLSVKPHLRNYDYGYQVVRHFYKWDGEILYTRLPQAAALGSMLKVPTIFEVHDIPSGRMGPLLFRRFVRGPGAKRLVVITQALREAIHNQICPLPKPPFSMIAPDGVDLSRYEKIPSSREARISLRSKLFPALPEKTFTVGYTGHLYEGRGIRHMLEVAKRLPEFTFLLVGGEPPAVKKVQDEVEFRNLGNVFLTGFISNSKLPFYQAACDVLLMPYQTMVAASSGGNIAPYLSPMKLFEYLATGRVILSSDLPVFREVLHERNSILLPPGKVGEWVEALSKISSDLPRQRSLGEQAREESKRYTWESRVEKIFETLHAWFNSMTLPSISSRRFQIGGALLTALILAVFLAWISPGFSFGPFASVILLSAFLMCLGWWSFRCEAIPGWIGKLMVGAAILRIALGITWFLTLPVWGYGSEVEEAGYVMSDASRRDTAAWNLAESDDPLISAFHEYRLADQYGGMLFLSATVYRLFGGEIHQPLMMIVLTASFSALAVLFTWGFVRLLWGEPVAGIAVWILAIYPEAVLLGSSQMREAFLVTLMSMACFGLVKYRQEPGWKGIGWILLALAFSFPLSTMFSVMLLSVLVLLALILFREKAFGNWVIWAVLGGLLILGIVAVGIFGERIYPDGASNPLALIRQWLVFSGRWEKRAAALSSGWFEKIFNQSPEWTHIWLVLGYGTLQPFLPAALIAKGNSLWRIVALWRSIGWTLMLIPLIYAPFRVIKKSREGLIAGGVTVIVWAGILLAAFRGGGDQWDNPRYRVVFICLQVSLAAWVWIRQRESSDPWFRRILVGLGFVFAWFIPWYLRRYSDSFTWPIIDLFKTIALGIITAIMYWLWDWARCEDLSGKTGDNV